MLEMLQYFVIVNRLLHKAFCGRNWYYADPDRYTCFHLHHVKQRSQIIGSGQAMPDSARHGLTHIATLYHQGDSLHQGGYRVASIPFSVWDMF